MLQTRDHSFLRDHTRKYRLTQRPLLEPVLHTDTGLCFAVPTSISDRLLQLMEMEQVILAYLPSTYLVLTGLVVFLNIFHVKMNYI